MPCSENSFTAKVVLPAIEKIEKNRIETVVLPAISKKSGRRERFFLVVLPAGNE
jgi:hypothetical protein